MFAAGEWALKRLFKFLLKRALRNIIKTRIDLDQLNVALGEGTLELREVLLNTDYLNEQLVGLPWEISAALVGSITAKIPVTAFYSESCVVRADEIYLTLRPRSLPAQQEAALGKGPSDTASALPADVRYHEESAISEGVKFIAGGLETLLQRLKIFASNIVVRLEIPVRPDRETGSSTRVHVVTLGLARVDYSGCSKQAGAVNAAGMNQSQEEPDRQPGEAGASLGITKQLEFSGLTLSLQLYQPAEEPQQDAAAATTPNVCCLLGGAGCSGSMSIDLSWGLTQLSPPCVALHVQLDPLHVCLSPGNIISIAAVALAVSHAVAARRALTPEAMQQRQQSFAVPVSEYLAPGSRSFIEGLMLPDCEGLVVEALQAGGRGGQDSVTGQEEVDEFFDAKSLLGSLQSSSVSWFMSAHESWSQAGQYTEDELRESPTADTTFYQAHDLAASIRQVQEPLEWELRAAVPAFTLALLYHEVEDASEELQAGCASHAFYPARLNVEVEGISLVAAGGSGGVQCGLMVRTVEASEHLPQRGAWDEEAGCWRAKLAEEFAHVPHVLDPSHASAWISAPTAGTFPLACASPPACQGSGFAPTLGQLSDLQASVYEASRQGGENPKEELSPSLWVMPVFSCGMASSVDSGSKGISSANSHASLLVHVGLDTSVHAVQGQRKESKIVDVTVVSLPLTLWVSTPFLERLSEFLHPIQMGLGELLPGRERHGSGQSRETQGPGVLETKAAVTAAIDSILDGVQDARADDCFRDSGASRAWKLRCFLPVCTAVAPIVEAVTPPARLRDAYSYVGLVLSMHTSATDVVIRELTQMAGDANLHDFEGLLTALLKSPAMVPTLAADCANTKGPSCTSPSELEAAAAKEEGVRSVECCLAASRAELLLVGSVPVDGDCLALGSCLVAHQVCEAALAPDRSAESSGVRGLSIGVQWSTARATCSYLIEDAWQRLGHKMPSLEPSEEQGRWDSDGLDLPIFRQQCLQSSPLHVRLTIPSLSISLSTAALASLANFADSLIQLAPQPELSSMSCSPGSDSNSGVGGTAATQVAVEVECSAECRLLTTLGGSEASIELFCAQLQQAQLLSVSNLSGVSGGGAQLLSCWGLDVWREQDTAAHTRINLLHSPVSNGAADLCSPGLQVVNVSRPLRARNGSACSVEQHPRTGRLYIATESRAVLSVHGCTLGTLNGDITLSWVQLLSDFFRLGGEAASKPAFPASTASHQLPQDGEACMSWTIQAEDIAVRYEPFTLDGNGGADKETSTSSGDDVAAILVVSSFQCWGKAGSVDGGLHQKKPEALPIHLRCISLHVAPAARRVGDWSPATPQHTFGRQLHAAGYTCAATEGEIVVEVPQGTAGWVCQVKNHMLHFHLSQRVLLMARQLWQQLQQASEGTAGQNIKSDSLHSFVAGSNGVSGDKNHSHGKRQQDHLASDVEAGAASSVYSSSSNSGTAVHAAGAQDWELPPADATWSSSSGKSSQVLRDVKDNAYSSRPATAHQESVFIDAVRAGGWYEALDGEPLSPAGSPPVLLDTFSGYAAGSQGTKMAAEEACEGRGVWFDASPMQPRSVHSKFVAGAAAAHPAHEPTGNLLAGVILEDYVKEGHGSQPAIRCKGPAGKKCAIEELSPEFPCPVSRTLLRDINISATIYDDATSSAVGLHRQLQLQMHRLCVQLDMFPAHTQYAQRIAVSIHTVEVWERKVWQSANCKSTAGPNKSGAAHVCAQNCAEWDRHSNVPGATLANGSNEDWRELLIYNALVGASRDPEECMVAVVVEAVRPDIEKAPLEQEQRLEIVLLPFKVQLEQGTLIFIQQYFAPLFDTLEEPAVIVDHVDAQPDSREHFNAGDPVLSAKAEFIQRCEVQPFAITIDYQPKTVDLAALRRGEITEIFNLFPWGGVTLDMRHVRLFGVHDTPTLGTALVSAWVDDIVRYQAHKFLAGIAPIRSLCKVTSAAMHLLAIPVEQLFVESSGPANNRRLRRLSDTNLSRQLRRGIMSMAKAIAAEAVSLGIAVTSSTHDVLS